MYLLIILKVTFNITSTFIILTPECQCLFLLNMDKLQPQYCHSNYAMLVTDQNGKIQNIAFCLYFLNHLWLLLHNSVILVFSYMITFFPVYSFPKAFSSAFTHYCIDPKTNTIKPFPVRNTQHSWTVFGELINLSLHPKLNLWVGPEV